MPTHFSGQIDQVLALDTMIKLTRATDTFLARIARHNTHPGLTVTQFATLEVLYHLGSMSQADICGKLLKSGGNTTLVVDNLEKQGLVERRRDEHDRRVVFVELTAEGLAMIESVFPGHAAAVTEEMSVLTAEEQIQLGQLCKKLGLGRGNENPLAFEDEYSFQI